MRVEGNVGAPLGPDRLVAAAGLAPGDPTTLRADAKRALKDRPVDGQAYRLLAQVADAEGNPAQAERLYRVAIKRDPREWVAQMMLTDTALSAGAAGEAVEHLDAALRVAPFIGSDVLTAFLPHLSDAAIRDAMAAVLASNPPWAGSLMTALRDPTVQADHVEALMATLSRLRPLNETERSVRIEALVRLGRPREARAVWFQSLGQSERRASSDLYNGGFEAAEQAEGRFSWRWSSQPGMDIAVDRTNPHSGSQALRIDFSGRPVELKGPEQWVALEAGIYTLSAWTYDTTDTTRPFLWKLSCASGTQLATIELSTVKPPKWSQDQARFEVPPNCPMQRLVLSHASRSMEERRLGGSLLIDDIVVRKVPLASAGSSAIRTQ
ncbi:tetratricopeptide repeat protein [Lysobacter sp. FW306-1B-D06B]|uniref:tetratricopeptide repeat protein n=1 Tax=Lysobacter sp. FW306-1B-D06B TaxID=3140250 RepID=UPI00314079C5